MNLLDLPNEILHQILSHTNTKHATSLCRKLTKLAYATPTLWTEHYIGSRQLDLHFHDPTHLKERIDRAGESSLHFTIDLWASDDQDDVDSICELLYTYRKTIAGLSVTADSFDRARKIFHMLFSDQLIDDDDENASQNGIDDIRNEIQNGAEHGHPVDRANSKAAAAANANAKDLNNNGKSASTSKGGISTSNGTSGTHTGSEKKGSKTRTTWPRLHTVSLRIETDTGASRVFPNTFPYDTSRFPSLTKLALPPYLSCLPPPPADLRRLGLAHPKSYACAASELSSLSTTAPKRASTPNLGDGRSTPITNAMTSSKSTKPALPPLQLRTLVLDGGLKGPYFLVDQILDILSRFEPTAPGLQQLWIKEQNAIRDDVSIFDPSSTSPFLLGKRLTLDNLTSLSLTVPGCGTKILSAVCCPRLERLHLDGGHRVVVEWTKEQKGLLVEQIVRFAGRVRKGAVGAVGEKEVARLGGSGSGYEGLVELAFTRLPLALPDLWEAIFVGAEERAEEQDDDDDGAETESDAGHGGVGRGSTRVIVTTTEAEVDEDAESSATSALPSKPAPAPHTQTQRTKTPIFPSLRHLVLRDMLAIPGDRIVDLGINDNVVEEFVRRAEEGVKGGPVTPIPLRRLVILRSRMGCTPRNLVRFCEALAADARLRCWTPHAHHSTSSTNPLPHAPPHPTKSIHAPNALAPNPDHVFRLTLDEASTIGKVIIDNDLGVGGAPLSFYDRYADDLSGVEGFDLEWYDVVESPKTGDWWNLLHGVDERDGEPFEV